MKTSLRWLFIICLNAACSLSSVNGQTELSTANVTVEVFGPFGREIKAATVRLLTADRTRDVSAAKGSRVFANVPFGRYVLMAASEGGSVAEREVVVNEKELLVRLGLPFPSGDRDWPGGDLTISGTIVPVPGSMKGWWVRVEGTFLHVRREAVIDRLGHFSVSGLEMGSYLVEVFDNAKLAHLETVEIDSRSPTTHLQLRLSGKGQKE